MPPQGGRQDSGQNEVLIFNQQLKQEETPQKLSMNGPLKTMKSGMPLTPGLKLQKQESITEKVQKVDTEVKGGDGFEYLTIGDIIILQYT